MLQTLFRKKLSLNKIGEYFDDHEKKLVREILLGIQTVLGMPSANGHRPLHVAVISDVLPDTLECLCRLCPQALRARDIDHRLPLHLALSHGADFILIRQLVAEDPLSIHVRAGSDVTPMQMAVMNRCAPGVILELARADAESRSQETSAPSALDCLDRRGRTLLELAIAHNAPKHVVEELTALSPPLTDRFNVFASNVPQNSAAALALRETWASDARAQRREQFARARKAVESDVSKPQPDVEQDGWGLATLTGLLRYFMPQGDDDSQSAGSVPCHRGHSHVHLHVAE
jgi:hypothetical protein